VSLQGQTLGSPTLRPRALSSARCGRPGEVGVELHFDGRDSAVYFDDPPEGKIDGDLLVLDAREETAASAMRASIIAVHALRLSMENRFTPYIPD